MGEKDLQPQELDDLYKALEDAGVEMIDEKKDEPTKEEELLDSVMDDDDENSEAKDSLIDKMVASADSGVDATELDIEPNLEDISEIQLAEKAGGKRGVLVRITAKHTAGAESYRELSVCSEHACKQETD